MKLIREHINEKFTEEFDPIKDMGIGYKGFENLEVGDVLRCLKESKYFAFNDKTPFPATGLYIVYHIKHLSKNELQLNLVPYGYTINPIFLDIRKNILNGKERTYSQATNTASISRWKKYFKVFKESELNKNTISEAFTEESDPIYDMGIGFKIKIKKWLDEYEIKHYTINDDLTIDVNENVILKWKGLTEFPSYIQFNKIQGMFTLQNNHLTSLRGCPVFVTGLFSCSNNRLKSLEFAPKYVGASFYCHGNYKNFSRRDVKKVCAVNGEIQTD